MAGGVTDMGVKLMDMPSTCMHAVACDVAIGNAYICDHICISLQSDYKQSNSYTSRLT